MFGPKCPKQKKNASFLSSNFFFIFDDGGARYLQKKRRKEFSKINQTKISHFDLDFVVYVSVIIASKAQCICRRKKVGVFLVPTTTKENRQCTANDGCWLKSITIEERGWSILFAHNKKKFRSACHAIKEEEA